MTILNLQEEETIPWRLIMKIEEWHEDNSIYTIRAMYGVEIDGVL